MASTMARWLAFLAVAAMIATAAAAEGSAGVNGPALQACNPSQLSSCLPAISTSAPPTGQCCGNLRQQGPCLCGYLRNPNFRQYLSSPGARKVASACGVPLPRC
ncbi:unnamed protein product [Linum tenue]|uniref:Bifunctional inhibitor/plant lipid transfer protein/seed storage helical domain-containing protein n=2 Tax=Linum tenue TaxID=586396 RepID=A0AAV0MYR6_9ROSI|nr:unnamed protein product [Linum tenue]